GAAPAPRWLRQPGSAGLLGASPGAVLRRGGDPRSRAGGVGSPSQRRPAGGRPGAGRAALHEPVARCRRERAGTSAPTPGLGAQRLAVCRPLERRVGDARPGVSDQRLPLPIGSRHPVRRLRRAWNARMASRGRAALALFGVAAAGTGAYLGSVPPSITVGLDRAGYHVGAATYTARGGGVSAGAAGPV